MYTQQKINEVLTLSKTGLSRPQIARKTKMNLASVNYYVARRPKRLKKSTVKTTSSTGETMVFKWTPKSELKQALRFIVLELAKALK